MIYTSHPLLSCDLIPVRAAVLARGEERQQDVFIMKLQPANVQQRSGLLDNSCPELHMPASMCRGGESEWPPSSLQPTDKNDDLFKWPITMETLYKSIPAIHTEEGKGRGRETDRLERTEKKGLEINSQKLSATEKGDGREGKRGGFGKEERHMKH